jgi:hypothetical protein
MSYAFNAYHYIALGCAAVVLFIIIQYFSALVTFVRSIFERRASRKRAVERLRNLPRGEPLEPQTAVTAELPPLLAAEVEPIPKRAEPLEIQPAVSTDVPLPVSTEVEPILEHAEPLYSGGSQLPLDSIVQQNILDALIVDQLTDAVADGPSEVQTHMSREVSPPVDVEVEPIPERAEALEIQPAVRTDVPLPVSAEVEPILEHAEPLEAQPDVSTKVPLPVSTEVEPILEHAEPVYSGGPQLPLNSIVQQNILEALIVDQLPDVVTDGPSEVQPHVSTEVSLPVAAEVELIVEGTKALKVQPAVNTEVSQAVRAIVQPIVERAKPLKIQPAVSTQVPLPVRAKAPRIIEREEPFEPQPAQGELPLPVGSKVWAVCKFGSVPKGTPGIITGLADGRFFWQSPTYLCTFADNRKVHARPKDIEVYNHGHSLQELEHPNLGSILSRRMTLRAQQLLSQQRPTHPPRAGRTEPPNGIAETISEA